MYGILLGKESVQGQLFASIFDYKASILTAFHQNLVSYLQENSIYYANPKNVKTDLSSNLDPKVGDFVAYVDGSKMTHFGIVDAIMADNVVSLRVIKYGKMVHQSTHTRICRLLFRPLDEKNYVNV